MLQRIVLLIVILNSILGSAVAQGVDTLPQQMPATNSLHQTAPILPDDTIQQKKEYEIGGVVIDKRTNEGIPFAILYFEGTAVGTSAALDGVFSISLPQLPSDTLSIKAIGYDVQQKILKKDKYHYELYIELTRTENQLEEFVLRPGEDPAVILFKNILRHKADNDPNRIDNYKCEVYNKLEVDLQQLSKSQFERLPVPYMRKLSFIYENLDTTEGGKPFLPFYLTETISDYYFQRKPKRQREFIKAVQTKGFDNESVTRVLGNMYQNLNLYDNYIRVFDKDFVSPISHQGLFFYQYKIKDTQVAYGYNIILVQFTPRRSGENCFSGDFWVVDSVYAIQRVSMQVAKGANINWVESVDAYKEFAPLADSTWFPVKDKFIVAFSPTYSTKLPGLIGRKTTSFKSILLNDALVAAVVNDPQYKFDVILTDTAQHSSNTYWEAARHDVLSENEKAIYKMIDTLETLPVFKRYKNLIRFFASGVKDIGPLELGPYWYFYSSNVVEGKRFRLSLGTTPKFLKDVYLSGYVAYGTADNRFKYKGSALWLLDRSPRMYLYGAYTHDVDRRANYYDEVSSDNIFNTVARKDNIPWKLSFEDEYRAEFFKEYYNGFSHQFAFVRKKFEPYQPLPSWGIFADEHGNPSGHIINTELNLRLRFAYKEKFLEGNYYRFSMGTKYPIAEMRVALGLKNVFGGGYRYKKIIMSVSDNIPLPPAGVMYANVFGGKYFGVLPYPLLEIHPGNEFYVYNKQAFNMMNSYEFISDQFVGLNIEHNFGGGFFNYIPYLKELKMRQFWTAKVLYGDLSDANKALNFNKGYTFRTLNQQPYIEVGTGVSNILQVLRVDFVWRVSPKAALHEPLNRRFGVFGSVQFKF